MATIKEFLVALGFKIDTQGLNKFTHTIADATKILAAFTAVAEASGVSVTTAIGAIANSMERLYFASRRTGASVEGIQAFGFAAGQMGSSVQSAQASLESFAYFLRSSPGAIGIVRSLGVTASDTTQMLIQLGEAISKMPMYRAMMYGQLMGIDYRTLIALTQGLGQFTVEYTKMYHAAGLSGEQAAQGAHNFMNELRLTVGALEILAQKVATELVGSVGQDIRKFRETIVANFGPISHAIESVVKGIVWLADTATRLAVRLVDALKELWEWFGTLDQRSRLLVEAIGLLTVGMRLFIASFVTSPLGRFLALLTAILLLYDDYKTYKSGGKSLIDWGKLFKDLEPLTAKLKEINDWLKTNTGVSLLQVGLAGLLVYVAGPWATGMIAALSRVNLAFVPILLAINAIAGIADMWKRGIFGNIPSDESKQLNDLGLGPNLGPGNQTLPGARQGSSERSMLAPAAQLGNAATAAMKFFLSRGYSLAGAAGIVANIQAESGFNPGDVGDSGLAYGLAQWHPERQRAIAGHFGKFLQDMSFYEQLQAIDWEINQGQYADVGRLAKTSGNPGAVGASVSLDYEGPAGGQAEANIRAALALQHYNEGLRQNMIGGGQGGGAPVIHQTNNITINGAGDPAATQAAVNTALRSSNADLTRNLQAVTR